MLGAAQCPASAGAYPWDMPSVQHKWATPAQVQQPVVIGVRRQTEAEMIAEMLSKLPLQAPSRGVAGGSNPSNAVVLQSTGEDLASMVQKIFTRMPPNTSRCVICPPPGLSSYDPQARQVPVGLRQSIGVGPMGMMDVYGFSKAADEEQSSTNDGGEHDAFESLPSEDEFTHMQAFRSLASSGGMTTLMVRNVPVMYTQEMLLLEWKNEGMYDFLYLPRTGQTNLSYAFINFVSEAHAFAFKAEWHKKRLAHFTARKPLNISFADVQGLEANVLQLKKKRVRRIEMRQCQPMIIKDGRLLDLAEAVAIMQK